MEKAKTEISKENEEYMRQSELIREKLTSLQKVLNRVRADDENAASVPAK